MSSNLYWRPVPTDPPDNKLPYALKKAIAQRFWGHDGSLNGGPVVVDRLQEGYFKGLRDGGVEGAQEVLDLLTTHGVIDLEVKE